jgi:hypothetical protein
MANKSAFNMAKGRDFQTFESWFENYEKGVSTYAEGGEIPEGYHQMPNGEIMPDSAHYVKGGSVKTKDFECLTFLHWYK